jgi:DNA-binding NtrC family response regulator
MSSILVVEDDSSVAEMVQAVLEENGFEVQIAPSAEIAKQLIALHQPELAMIDIILPGQGGMDLILDLHASCPNLGIIITSGKIDMNKSTFKVLAHQFGVISILPKPFTIDELISTVQQASGGLIPT